MKLCEFCKDEKPRERLLNNGVSSLSKAELLAILLHTGTKDINVIELSRKILQCADNSLCNLSSLSLTKLCSIDGIGKAKACTIIAAFELGRRFSQEFLGDRIIIDSPEKIYKLMLSIMKGLDHEQCWSIFLNKSNYIIDKILCSKGGGDSTIIDIKSIIRLALEKKAFGLILCHNHPSNNPKPSLNDIKYTEELRKALSHFDISLIDHIIVCDDYFYSFAESKTSKRSLY